MMKRTLLATALCALASPVLAGNWYIAGAGGPNWADDSDFTFDPAVISNGSLELDPGFAGLGALGYDWGPFRLEGELSYRQNDADTVSGTVPGAPPIIIVGPPPGVPFSASADGDVSAWALLANLVWDLELGNTGGWLTPYIGAGAGYALVDVDVSVPGVGLRVNDDDGALAWQAFAGLAARLDDLGRWHLTADYRYFSVPDVEGLATNVAGLSVDSEYDTHNLMVGLRYTFGVKPPVVAPVVAPAPAPREYVVYFDFDKTDLDAEAMATLDRAAADAKAGNATVIRVVGHTDTMGTQDYNQGLSERRAGVVKDALIERGVGAGAIVTEGRSFNDLAVQTGPQVKERLNRRATIKF